MKLDIQNVLGNITAVMQKIGAELIPWSPNFNWNKFDQSGFRERLERYEEIEGVLLKDIIINGDGTLEVGGRKVLVYIRDRRDDSRYGLQLPKFHIADCVALQKSRREGSYDKYVVSIKTNGSFIIRILPSGDEREYPLNVCKYCLGRLNYKGYNTQSKGQKKHIYDKFSIREFFELYKTTDIVQPKYSNITAPTNDYTKDWDIISSLRKQRMNFTCEECGIHLKTRPNFLEIHHVNRRKNDNRPENLKVLCVACHSDQGGDHGHLKNTSEYRDFVRIYRKP